MARIQTVKVGVKFLMCGVTIVYSRVYGRAALLMVVKENEMNVYGQRKFESIMVLKYVYYINVMQLEL